MSQSNPEEFAATVFQLMREIRKHTHRSQESNTLSPMQWHTLFFLKERQHITTSELSRKFDVAIPTVTKLVDKLVFQNFLRRTPDPKDRRVTHLELTPQGLGTLRQFQHQHLQQFAQIFKLVPEQDLISLQRILNELLKKLRQ